MKLVLVCCAGILVMLMATVPGTRGDGPSIAIDVGHFSADPGAMSARGVPEFEFNRELATLVRDFLASQSIRAFLIGAEGDMTNLRKRTEVARTKGATFLLSIHHDSVQPHYLEEWIWDGVPRRFSDRFSGYSLFVSRKNRHLAASLRCASAIGGALRRQGLRPSAHHAEKIRGESKEWADEENGVYYYDRLSVLRNASCPAVLLEGGIIVNRDDEEKLRTGETRRAIAAAVTEGLTACGMGNEYAKGSESVNGFIKEDRERNPSPPGLFP